MKLTKILSEVQLGFQQRPLPIVMDIVQAEKLAKDLNLKLKVPFVNAIVTTLGGERSASILIKLSLDDQNTWPNGIFHNSRFSQFHVQHDGVIEQFQRARAVPKFRKFKFKTPADVMKKLNDWATKG